jgi:hypothetical protein
MTMNSELPDVFSLARLMTIVKRAVTLPEIAPASHWCALIMASFACLYALIGASLTSFDRYAFLLGAAGCAAKAVELRMRRLPQHNEPCTISDRRPGA